MKIEIKYKFLLIYFFLIAAKTKNQFLRNQQIS